MLGPGPDGRALAGVLNPESESLAWPEETPDEADRQLRENDIDYLLIWKDCAVSPRSLRLENEAAGIDGLGLRIYRVKPEK